MQDLFVFERAGESSFRISSVVFCFGLLVYLYLKSSSYYVNS